MSKFSYLKELVIPKVRLLIDSLPFTSEGYTRAKIILLTKYGKPCEVANAHVQNIMSLPQINNANPQKFTIFQKNYYVFASIRYNGEIKRDKWVCESYTG